MNTIDCCKPTARIFDRRTKVESVLPDISRIQYKSRMLVFM
jgi:hypothetical protein